MTKIPLGPYGLPYLEEVKKLKQIGCYHIDKKIDNAHLKPSYVLAITGIELYLCPKCQQTLSAGITMMRKHFNKIKKEKLIRRLQKIEKKAKTTKKEVQADLKLKEEALKKLAPAE